MSSELRILNIGPADVHPSEIHEHPENPNNGDDEAVGDSIGAIGFYGRIIVSADTGNIVAGNTRYRAMVAAGADRIPIERVKLTPEEEIRVMLADNQTARRAYMDKQKEAALLADLAQTETGFEGLGYDAEDVTDLLALLHGGGQGTERNVSFTARTPPEEFPKVDGSLETQYKCPKCAYEWSGNPKL